MEYSESLLFAAIDAIGKQILFLKLKNDVNKVSFFNSFLFWYCKVCVCNAYLRKISYPQPQSGSYLIASRRPQELFEKKNLMVDCLHFEFFRLFIVNFLSLKSPLSFKDQALCLDCDKVEPTGPDHSLWTSPKLMQPAVSLAVKLIYFTD